MCYTWHMKSVGIGELRQHAGKYLARVKAGETIEVTERGEPIALITPIKRGREGVLDRLRREGRLVGPERPGGLAGIKPIRLPPDQEPLGESIVREREESPF